MRVPNVFTSLQFPSVVYANIDQETYDSAGNVDEGRGVRGNVIVAVMGLTGVGKSNFISLLGAQHVQTQESTIVGSSLNSETRVPDHFICYRRGWKVFLVDTPGFDDGAVSNSRILKMIAAVLAEFFENKKNVDGVLYLHRIVDNRMGGHAKQNVDVFDKLCGAAAMKRVVLLTTMWDTVNPGVPGFRQQDFEKREEELIAGYWDRMIRHGATPFRSSNTNEAALSVLDHILDTKVQIDAEGTDVTDLGLRIQDELVSEKWPLHLTGAGQVMAKEFEENLARLKENEAVLVEKSQHPLGEAQRRQVSIDLLDVRKRIKDIEDEQKSYFSWNWRSIGAAVLGGVGVVLAFMAHAALGG